MRDARLRSSKRTPTTTVVLMVVGVVAAVAATNAYDFATYWPLYWAIYASWHCCVALIQGSSSPDSMVPDRASASGSWDRRSADVTGTLHKTHTTRYLWLVPLSLSTNAAIIYMAYLAARKAEVATATDPSASRHRCSPSGVASASSATGPNACSQIFLGAATLRDDSGTRPIHRNGTGEKFVIK